VAGAVVASRRLRRSARRDGRSCQSQPGSAANVSSFRMRRPSFLFTHYMTRWVFAGLLGTSISGVMLKSPSNALVEAAL
jgi:hypothetical protein